MVGAHDSREFEHAMVGVRHAGQGIRSALAGCEYKLMTFDEGGKQWYLYAGFAKINNYVNKVEANFINYRDDLELALRHLWKQISKSGEPRNVTYFKAYHVQLPTLKFHMGDYRTLVFLNGASEADEKNARSATGYEEALSKLLEAFGTKIDFTLRSDERQEYWIKNMKDISHDTLQARHKSAVNENLKSIIEAFKTAHHLSETETY